MAGKKPPLAVFTVIPPADESGRDFWFRIGSAWVNADRSVTVRLNALPLNGELIVKKALDTDQGSGPRGRR